MERRDELVRRSWETEVGGRAFFEALTDLLPEDRGMWELMAALEGTMASLAAGVAGAHGIEVDTAALEATGVELARALAAMGREEVLTSSIAIGAQGVPMYEELGTLLDEDEAWLTKELVAHVDAFTRYAEAELARTSGGDATLVAFLTRHGTEVPAAR